MDTAWKRLIAGQSGIRRLDEAIVTDVDCKVGGVEFPILRKIRKASILRLRFPPKIARRWIVSSILRSRRRGRPWRKPDGLLKTSVRANGQERSSRQALADF